MSTLDRMIAWLGGAERDMRRCGRDKGDLRSDNSGAIMIAGVFMAALLAAGVFFVIGTANAIVYREKLQDAADAVAYTSAGVHARGMNLIVLINLIMAALLAVLIMMRMIILILGIVIVACGICIAATIFCPLAGLCAGAMPTMVKIEKGLIQGANKYEKALNNYILPSLSKLEWVIALTTPYVGAYKGNKVSKEYAKTVTTGMAMSPSMVPGQLIGQKRIGLPVQEMDYDKFCKKSAELAVEYGFGWLPWPINKLIGAFAGGLAGTFSKYFCGDSGGKDFESIMNNKINDQVNEGCSDQKKSCSKAKDNPPPPACTGDYETDKNGGLGCVSKYCDDMGSLGFSFNMDKCKKDGKQAAADKQKESQFDPNNSGNQQGGGLSNWAKTPKEIWGEAKAGGIWFQVYGFTGGDEQWPRKMDKGIAIATKSGQMPKVEAGWGNYRLAQAEFYFDDKGSWDKLKDDAMWKMYWRARLRRFGITGLNLGQLGLGNLFDVVKKYTGDKWVDKLIGGNSSVGGSVLEKAGYDYLADKLKGVIQGAGAGFDSKIDSMLTPSWEIIH